MPWDLGWSAVAQGGVDVIDVQGGHFALLTEPSIMLWLSVFENGSTCATY
jgi:thioesterase domain-containing protein